jgi:RNA polymerase sigma-70 factor, ECF subfamily
MVLAAAMNTEEFDVASETIMRIRSGDPDALGAMISLYQHRLYRYLLRLAKDPALADDLFQQTWLRVMEKIGRFDAARNFEPWLFSLAHNLAVDYFRARRTESLDADDDSGVAAAEKLPGHDPGALDRLLAFERGALLDACMIELPAIYREVLTLRFEDDMKLEQIAQVVGVPLSTVKSRLHRALEGLRASVEERLARRRKI